MVNLSQEDLIISRFVKILLATAPRPVMLTPSYLNQPGLFALSISFIR